MTAAFSAGDARFFRRAGPHRLADIARAVGAEPVADGARLFAGVGPLQAATAEQVSFLDNRKYISALAASSAGAVIVHPEMVAHVPAGCVALVTPEPYAGWARVAAMFHPERPDRPGVHPAAVVDPSARVDPSAEIGPLAVIGADVEIGAGCRVGANSTIGDGVILGDGTKVGANCTVSHAVIGCRVTIAPGVRIGQEGFGFATIMQSAGPRHLTIPQLGRVLIEDDVDIGANTTIDRGSTQDTVIGAGSRLDNLVQIAHNVRLGRACVIVAQAGISGSCVLEDFVVVAGQAGFSGHLRIGRGARIGGKSGVMGDVPAGEEWVGSPARPVKAFFREVATLRKLVEEYAARRMSARVNPAPIASGPQARTDVD